MNIMHKNIYRRNRALMGFQQAYIHCIKEEIVVQAGVKLSSSYPSFLGLRHWIYTNPKIIDRELSSIVSLRCNDEIIGVWFNPELIVDLLYRGVPINNIKFWSDCPWKIKQAIGLGIQSDNVEIIKEKYTKAEQKEMKNSVDYSITNIPFGEYSRLRPIIENISSKKVMMIVQANSLRKSKEYNNIEYYRYLGKCFDNVSALASVIIIDPTGNNNTITIAGSDGDYIYDKLPPFQPGSIIADFKKALQIISLNLKTYRGIDTGWWYRKDVVDFYDTTGTPIAMTCGYPNIDIIDESKYANTTDKILSNCYNWSKIDTSKLEKRNGADQHKVGFTGMANEGELGPIKYIPKGIACGKSMLWYPVKDSNEANEMIAYLNNPVVKSFILTLKATAKDNSRDMWALIPHHSEVTKWINI